MLEFSPRSMLSKLLGLLVLISLVPSAVIGTLSFITSRSSLEKSVFEKLLWGVELRKTEINRYFESLVDMTLFLARSGPALVVIETAGASAGTGDKKSAKDPDSAKTLPSEATKFFQDFLANFSGESHSIDDVFLVNAVTGDIIFSGKGRKDKGSNLFRGPWKDTALARLFARVNQTGKHGAVDFSHYPPSDSVLAFVGAPIIGSEGTVIGMVAISIDPRRINSIMNPTEEMGRGTQVYLLGSDLMMRSQVKGDPSPTILKKKMDFEGGRLAFRHESGSGIMPDERGQMSLIAYTHVGINENPAIGADFEWAILADAEVAVALGPVDELGSRIILIGLILALITIVVAYISARALSSPLMEGVNVLASAAAQISTTVSQLATSSSQTLAAVSETTTTLEELRQSGQISSDKAKSVSEDSRKSLQVAHAGKEATDEIIGGMNMIKGQMESIGDTVIKLSEQSRSIEDIIDAVKDLADQSNLLAVNASIEAARAGEQGKGFSVVADEIKSLADQSKRATTQVRTILEDIRNSISSVVMATERGGKAVDTGVNQSQEAGQAIQAVTSGVHQASQALTVIVASAEQQSVGIDQVASAMDSIDQAMRQNVEGTRQLESAAVNLKDLGRKLANLVQGRT
jgi:methyl-accepting chemotaxis protein